MINFTCSECRFYAINSLSDKCLADLHTEEVQDRGVTTFIPTQVTQSSPAPAVVLSWHNIHVTVTSANAVPLHILKGVSGLAGPLIPPVAAGETASGNINHGSMLAVLGPSGAGKTVSGIIRGVVPKVQRLLSHTRPLSVL